MKAMIDEQMEPEQRELLCKARTSFCQFAETDCLKLPQKDHSSMNLMKAVLLDNQSTESVCANPSSVKNIRKADGILHLQTNASGLVINQQADLEGCGVVWFDDRAIANVLSFAEVEDVRVGLDHCVIHLTKAGQDFKLRHSGTNQLLWSQSWL